MADSAALSTGPKPSEQRPVIIGLYGVSGAGKSTLLLELKQTLSKDHFLFYEGSEVIDSIVPGGLTSFRSLEPYWQKFWRKAAIGKIKDDCAKAGNTAIVTGHFSFLDEAKGEIGPPVITSDELETFSHIVYLSIPPDELSRRRSQDLERKRPSVSKELLKQWQEGEVTQLRSLCLDHGIMFIKLSRQMGMLATALELMNYFRRHNEKWNFSQSMVRLCRIIEYKPKGVMLVFDADRTLSAVDGSTLFWDKIANQSLKEVMNLKKIFSSHLGYSYAAFQQATLLYEEAADDEEFEKICDAVASEISMYPGFVCLLHFVAKQNHVGAVVVTSGLRRVWEKVLEKEGLASTVKVIGAGRVADKFVVTAEVKRGLVELLQNCYDAKVWSFGDSPLDLGMLEQADRGIVVVGDKKTRSNTMDAALESSVAAGHRLKQAVIPATAPVRLDTTRLPLFKLTGSEIVDLVPLTLPPSIQVVHATDESAAKLLMARMRDATVGGPELCKAHRRAGKYLATKYLTEMIGLEHYTIPHVQGKNTSGHRLFHEEQTLIIAVMRAGEPMAIGVWETFPKAAFKHAKVPEDLEPCHVQGLVNVVLVDSVVNSGKTIQAFLKRIQHLHATVRIFVVAGVVQKDCLSKETLIEDLAHGSSVGLVALRLSENKYTGSGSTDTGNRLFNTTTLC